MIAEIALNSQARELGKNYDYEIPEKYAGTVTVGQKVTVFFGLGNILQEGFIVKIKDKSKIAKLKEINEITDEILNEREIKLANFISQKYFCNLGSTMNLFTMKKVRYKRENKELKQLNKAFSPNYEQKEAIDYLNKKIDENTYEEILLKGVTGSGKTEVYLQTISHAINMGKSAIVLVPEISLTPQTVRRFVERLGQQVAVIHSRLTAGEKYSEWERIKKGEALVVVGARSAIFSPIKNLGVVVIDEEHDSSYKSGQTPFYHARDVAEELCKLENAILILGSATPDMVTNYRANIGEIKRIELNKRANNSILPEVSLINMSSEIMNGNKTILSVRLYNEIENNLKNREQTILFLNKRGHSSFVNCRACGFVAKCRNCNIALTYHQDENMLICHYCGMKAKNLIVCPICKSNYIKYFGIGTQKVEEIIKKIFPSATTLRMDLDTTTKRMSHEELLRRFQDENIDILIGTQMIAKGHDFKNVTLVGVIAADVSLNINDFRATEKTFNLLTQVAGRAGRGEKKGRVVVQTYEPENYSIMSAKDQNYEEFYKQEIIVREELNYPPFCDIITINISGIDEKRVIEGAGIIRELFIEALNGIENVNILNAVPAPISKVKNKYRWRIIIKCITNDEITIRINNLLKSNKFAKIKDIEFGVDINGFA